MLKRFLILVAVLGAGCQGFPRRNAEPSTPGSCPPAIGQGAECPAPQACGQQPCAPPPPPCPPPKKQAAPEKAPSPPAEQVERVQQQAQIAQEVMLVPRTVYVPYVAQTPVAPVRLSGVNTIPGRVSSILERRELEPQAAPPSPPSRQEEAAPPPEREKLQELCRQLNERLNRIEAQMCQPPPCAPLPQECPVIQPQPSLPCPNPPAAPMPNP
jgi:hypothetical protein